MALLEDFGLLSRKIEAKDEKWLWEQDVFVGKYKGYKYIIRRMPFGYLCGYVQVTKKDKLLRCSDVFWEENLDELNVHGGITYNSYQNPLGRKVKHDKFYIGFDAGKFLDLNPFCVEKRVVHRNGMVATKHYARGEYRDLAYMRKQCKKLINQLVEQRRK